MKNRQPMAVRKPTSRVVKPLPAKTTNKGTTHTIPTSSLKAEGKPTGESSNTRGKKDPTFGIDLKTTKWDYYPLVEIVWVDAVATATIEWSDIDEILQEQLAPSRSVGYLIQDNTHRAVIVSLVNENDAAHAMIIPKGMIHHINTLRAPQ